MVLILSVQEFAKFQDISKKLNEPKIKKCIEKSQLSDLYDILGDFYFDVIKNKDSEDFKDLLEGCEFEINKEMYIHNGLKDILSDFAFARYMYGVNVNLTPFGGQSKYTQDSNSVDRNTLKDISKQTQIDASFKFKTIQKYILSKPKLFSRYKHSSCNGSGVSRETRFGGLRLTKL